MSLDAFLAFMEQYGLFFLFGVVFLEYLNFPGLPAAVVYPAAGVWLGVSSGPFVPALALTVAAGLAGSMVLYIIGAKGGPPLLAQIKKRSPAMGAKIDLYSEKLRKHANATVFIACFVPAVRTLIAIPAGAIGMRLYNYLLCAAIGITVYHCTLMLAGLFFGDLFFGE